MKLKWVRAKDGVFFGVCKGLARTFEVPVGAFRLLWLASTLFLGVGLGLYILLAICLPREDRLAEASKPWLLGVCSRLSEKLDIEIGVVRFLTVVLGLLSGGAAIIAYLVLYVVFRLNKEALP